MKILGFQWDSGNWPKCGSHGLSKTEIEALFESARVAPDPKHSGTEARYVAIGRVAADRLAFVGFTFRASDYGVFVRPVTARYMHAKEIRRYETQGSGDEER